MPVTASRTSHDRLCHLPTSARSILDPADIQIPEGYEVEPVLAGLSFPCGMGFADGDLLFLLESGSTWPTRPSTGRSLAGAAAAKVGEVAADVIGLGGGARGNWKDLRQLLLESMDSLGAFAIAEQLRYALGVPELADPAFRVVAGKTKDQLLIEEYMLEMGPVALLYHEDA
jgi:hypothetical protein